MANSTPVASNQNEPHDRLRATIDRHRRTPYRRPIARHNQTAFDGIAPLVEQADLPLIVDAGCGTGEFARSIAQRVRTHLIIAVDKSAARLETHRAEHHPDNLIVARCDLVDFWRLAETAGWTFDAQYLLYPNPWPKRKHLLRRWHAHPVFVTTLKISRYLEMRTNWRVYAQEFAASLSYYGRNDGEINSLSPRRAVTPFERKYQLSGHRLYRVSAGRPLRLD